MLYVHACVDLSIFWLILSLRRWISLCCDCLSCHFDFNFQDYYQRYLIILYTPPSLCIWLIWKMVREMPWICIHFLIRFWKARQSVICWDHRWRLCFVRVGSIGKTSMRDWWWEVRDLVDVRLWLTVGCLRVQTRMFWVMSADL